MIGVDVSTENRSAWHRFNRPRDLTNGFRLATFAKVWYTLNERIADCGLRIANLIKHEKLARSRPSLNLKRKIRNPQSAIRILDPCPSILSSTNAKVPCKGSRSCSSCSIG